MTEIKKQLKMPAKYTQINVASGTIHQSIKAPTTWSAQVAEPLKNWQKEGNDIWGNYKLHWP